MCPVWRSSFGESDTAVDLGQQDGAFRWIDRREPVLEIEGDMDGWHHAGVFRSSRFIGEAGGAK